MNADSRADKPRLILRGGEARTTSLAVAEYFGKRHAHVLRDGEVILTQVPDSFGKLNFGLTEHSLKNNLGFEVKKPMYFMSKDGFMLLAMGFTGKRALGYRQMGMGDARFWAYAQALTEIRRMGEQLANNALGPVFVPRASERFH